MIKYTIPYKSYDETSWRVDIDIPGYTGDPIFVNGKADEAGIMSFEGTTDELWESPVINTSMLTTMVSTGQVDVREIQQAKDRQFRYLLYRNDELKFSGYLIVDNMQRIFNSPPFDVQISATCGLNLLSGISYVHDNLDGGRIPLNYLRRVLMSNRLLGIDIPIRWSMRLRNNNPLINGDPMTSLTWAATGEGFADYGTEAKYCDYIVEGICKALQCRIFQADGAWWVLDIMEHMKDVIEYRECSNSIGDPVITEHTRGLTKIIGETYGFAREDSLFLIKPALSGVQVKYEQDQNENIIYNGNLDLVDSLSGFPYHWSKDNNVSFEEHLPITGRPGSAIELWLNTGDSGSFKMEQSLPIEANLLYKTLSWGFSVLPDSGFNTNEYGQIDWNKSPLKVSIKYTILENGDIVDYYLNEFGYWWNQQKATTLQQFTVTWNVPGVHEFTVIFPSTVLFLPGDIAKFSFLRNGNVEYYEFIFTENTSPDDALNLFLAGIPNSLQYLAGPANRGIVIYNVTDVPANYATVSKTPDSVENIRISIPNLKLKDVANVEFNGRMEVKIPDPGILNELSNVSVGKLMIEFKVTGSQRFVLDEIWMSVNQNSDVYKASLDDSAKVEEYSLKISSAFSGFYYSNFMRTWGKSNEDYLFKDTDGYVGSLTAQYARSIMKSRNMPLDIFNGTINVRGHDWSYLDNYDIVEADGRFIPLTPTYNTEKNEVNLIAIEGRNDSDINLNIVHLPSEKKQK